MMAANLPDGALTSSKLAPGAVQTANLLTSESLGYFGGHNGEFDSLTIGWKAGPESRVAEVLNG